VRRHLGALLLNAEGNLLLASTSLLQQLMSEIESADEAAPQTIEESTAYQLTRNLVLQQMARDQLMAPGGSYQFKLSSALPGVTPRDEDELLVSPIYAI
jgi:hypothetical protein